MDTSPITFGITVAGVTVCAMVTTIFTQRGLRKTKQFELFFESRSSAYFNFLSACYKISDMDNLAQLSSFYDASVRAQLFASASTQELIDQCQKSRIDILRAKKNGLPVSEQFKLAERQNHIRGELIQSMQLDLQSDRLKPRQLIGHKPNKAPPDNQQNDKQQD